jgi:hypothetical protein
MKKMRIVTLVGGLACLGPLTARAGVVLFDNPTETIAVSAGTTLSNASTYEARILFTDTFQGQGIVFNEWTNGQEDKLFVAGPSFLAGLNWPVNVVGNCCPEITSPTITLNTWHHIAMVFDGSVESLYLDGTQVITRAASGTISNAAGLPFIGASPRFGGVAFVGYLDWLRVSDVARYSGASFVSPLDQPTSDANTQLLFYFDESPGSTMAVDQSSFHRDGALGTGFAGATSPMFTSDPLGAVPEPSTLVLVSGGCLWACFRRRNCSRADACGRR